MRGYGDSEKPQDGYDGRTLAEDFRQLVSHLGFKQIHLVAHDMGAPPALLYAAEHPDEVGSLTYLDEPVLTSENMQQVHSFTPEGTKNGGLWWWSFALAGDAAERLVVGKEREFLMWSYDNYTADRSSIGDDAVNEYLRTFAAPGGVTGAFGVYRSVFETITQTESLTKNKTGVPVLGLGGEKSMGEHTKQMLEGVAKDVRGGAVAGCGHFIPDEQPDYLVNQLFAFFDEARGKAAGASGHRQPHTGLNYEAEKSDDKHRRAERRISERRRPPRRSQCVVASD